MTLTTIDPKVLTVRDALRSLRSGVCPACGEEKRPGKTFCSRDWHRLKCLSKSSALALFTGTVCEKYVAALQVCCEEIELREFVLPAEGKR